MMSYLKVLLSVEGDRLCFHFPVLDVYFVATQYNGYVLAHSYQVPVPVGNILVGDTRRHIKHNDGTLSLDIVSVSQSSKLFLPSSVPYIESDWSTVGIKYKRMYFYSKSCCETTQESKVLKYTPQNLSDTH